MIVVTGGAGYIGRYVVQALRRAGADPFVIDDLRTGHPTALEGVPHVISDIADIKLDWSSVEAVVHLAASAIVSESVQDPEKYLKNNVRAAMSFLSEAVERRIPIVYSSTATIYGDTQRFPIPEDHPTNPINPYGVTKLTLEKWLLTKGICASLRYFNAAGGLELHNPETHLIPRILTTKGPFPVYGSDYPTPDGTCIRDYVHVEDLAHAHVLAIGKHGVWNLGSGRGTSVLELVTRLGRVPRFEARRPGDPARLVADIRKAEKELGWTPQRCLDDVLRSAADWISSSFSG